MYTLAAREAGKVSYVFYFGQVGLTIRKRLSKCAAGHEVLTDTHHSLALHCLNATS